MIDEKKLFQLLDSRKKGRAISKQTLVSNVAEELGVKDAYELELLLAKSDKYLRGSFNDFSFPVEVIDFALSLVEFSPANDVLIPWADTGILPLYLISKLSSGVLTINTRSNEHHDFLKRILPHCVSIKHGDPVEKIQIDNAYYDLVIGGMLISSREKVEYIKDDESITLSYSDAMIAVCMDRLKPGGKAVFIVPPSMFYSRVSTSLRKNAEKLGFNFTAIIDLPKVTLVTDTQMSVVLMIIERSQQDKVFTARYVSNKKKLGHIQKNYNSQKNGKQTSQGIWQNFENIRSFRVLEENEHIMRLAKRSGLERVPFLQVIDSIKHVQENKDENFHKDNCIYFPQAGLGDVVSMPDDLSVKNRRFIQVSLKKDRVSSAYMAGFFNYSDLGKAIRSNISGGSTSVAPVVKIDSLKRIDVYFPDTAEQNNIIKIQDKLSSLKSEVKEIENHLWQEPHKTNDIIKRVEAINKTEGFTDWID